MSALGEFLVYFCASRFALSDAFFASLWVFSTSSCFSRCNASRLDESGTPAAGSDFWFAPWCGLPRCCHWPAEFVHASPVVVSITTKLSFSARPSTWYCPIAPATGCSSDCARKSCPLEFPRIRQQRTNAQPKTKAFRVFIVCSRSLSHAARRRL